MLTGKQKRYLRSLAMTQKPLINVGKNGLTTQFAQGVADVLEPREMVKIALLPSAEETPAMVADFLAEALPGLEVAQIIGRTLVVFRPAEHEKHRKLSLEVAKRG
ncbi:YhbY family RNA-binding protein [Lacticaseibacillus mingshuiensis]|uniref:YhbY family RNA-binding protein n=1 Tax=Lacticaseibacillus mingshuiensis TaxID=2799574 RepID=A0ABW4CGD2_9LACO|nr:YhbY family RNA-binding protein [Lacticaseibacillus mingshuiensis]